MYDWLCVSEFGVMVWGGDRKVSKLAVPRKIER